LDHVWRSIQGFEGRPEGRMEEPGDVRPQKAQGHATVAKEAVTIN
jgi:hypothetical protein